MGKRLGCGGFRARSVLLPGLLLLASLARADVAGDWLGKVPPPPKNLDEALALCGGGDGKTYDPAKDPWRKFEPQIQAAIDKNQKDMQAKMGGNDPQAQQDMAAQMMSQMADQMNDPSAAMANMQSVQTYSQYMGSLGPSVPDVAADAHFKAALTAGQAAVNTALKARDAGLAKCPVEHGEAGDFPIAACANPIEAEAERKKADAANAYLAAVNQAWPQYLAGVKDYLAKVAALPPGVDANNPQIKLQRQGIPTQQLDGIKKTGEVTQRICSGAVSLKTQYNPSGT